MILEIACFSYEDTLIAQEAGADRIELCKNMGAGGLTPSRKASQEACERIKIPIFIMIRPKAGSFCYSDTEFEKMKEQIRFSKKIKSNGIVFGILDEKNRVNKRQCKELVKLAKPLACTFHRAFDETENLEQALEDIIESGFTRVLTSGGKGNAAENIETLARLIKLAGKRIAIMPGGGIRSANMEEIISKTKCREIHSAATHKKTHRINREEIKAMKLLLR